MYALSGGTSSRTSIIDWEEIAWARYKEQHDCLNYLLEKGCPEPTDEEYAKVVEQKKREELGIQA